MILSYAKPYDEKKPEQLEKKKKQASDFSTFLIDDMKTKKNHNSVLLI